MHTRRWAWPVAVGVLLLALVATSGGWWLSARSAGMAGSGCYSRADGGVRVEVIQGAATERSTFLVTEEEDRVVLGYDEDRAAGMFTSEGYPVSYDIGLKRPLGEREVVDPAGDRIPECR